MSERTYQVIIGALVLVVLVGGWMMIAKRSTAPAGDAMQKETAGDIKIEEVDGDAASATPSMTASAQTADGEHVEVADQSAGMSVMIDSVSLEKRGWVAIEDDKGWILGAARLEAGVHSNVAVELLRGTEKGATYKAVLFVDDGDSMFDLHMDSMINNTDGSALSAAFIAK